MGPPIASANPDRPSGTVRIYIDNSNLWIQGQKTYAENRGLREPWDPTWRFDVGRLKAVLLEKSGLLHEERDYTVKVRLYGSTPPPVDTVWRAIESHNVQVSTFARSSWTGREKEVDAEIIADSVDESSEDYHRAAGSVFMIVSGDRDLDRAVQKISQKYGFQVHVWSWRNALAGIYSQRQANRVDVHYLDDYINDIGFHETAFRLDRNTLDPHSIVVIDAFPKADAINEFLLNLRTSTYRYVKSHQNGAPRDLIIVPAFARYMTYDEKENLYRESSKRLQAIGLQVFTYLEYSQHTGAEPDIVVETSNRFHELPGGGFGPHVDDAPDDEEQFENDDGFTEVNTSARRQKARMRTNEQKSRSRCDWRLYCRHELDCKYGHTPDEENHFKLIGHKKPTKLKLCNNPECIRGSGCHFAHGEADLFCPTCGRSGTGHEMWDCPESDRNSGN